MAVPVQTELGLLNWPPIDKEIFQMHTGRGLARIYQHVKAQ